MRVASLKRAAGHYLIACVAKSFNGVVAAIYLREYVEQRRQQAWF